MRDEMGYGSSQDEKGLSDAAAVVQQHSPLSPLGLVT